MAIRRVYLDYAAATPLDPRVRRVMAPFLVAEFGNPSSVHAEGRRAKQAVEKARQDVATVLGAKVGEIVFTSGATESINLAVRGCLQTALATHCHVVSVATEHKAMLRALEDAGCEVTLVPVGEDGVVSADAVLAAIRPDTALVSIMYVNNEIGTIAPIAAIGKGVRKMRRDSRGIYPIFHTDAVQAAGYLPLNVDTLGVDLMSLSGAKIYGPKGSGLLYVRSATPIAAQIVGGAQEHSLRAGTENVAAIVGGASALQFAQQEREALSARLRPLQKMLIDGIRKIAPDARLNGSLTERVAGNINVSVVGVDGEAVVMYLDERGIAASTASSCTSSSSTSHVLRALGLSDQEVEGSVRFTLGHTTSKRDIRAVLQVLPGILSLLRI